MAITIQKTINYGKDQGELNAVVEFDPITAFINIVKVMIGNINVTEMFRKTDAGEILYSIDWDEEYSSLVNSVS